MALALCGAQLCCSLSKVACGPRTARVSRGHLVDTYAAFTGAFITESLQGAGLWVLEAPVSFRRHSALTWHFLGCSVSDSASTRSLTTG